MSVSWFHSRRDQRATCRLQERRRRFAVESLEGRQMLSTFTVTSNANSTAAGTLRWAITQSNQIAATASAPNHINFNLPSSEESNGVYTIALQSALPALTQPVVINGMTQPGANGQPVIQVDGTNAGLLAVGVQVNSGASGSTVEGLTIKDFSDGGGVLLDGASDVTVSADHVGLVGGLDVNGFGIWLENGAAHNTLTGDIVSGNNVVEVEMTGSGTTGNVVEGDTIGDDVVSPAAGRGDGVVIAGGAASNTVGGTAGPGDAISGNQDGVIITGSGTEDNVVEDDDIGPNAHDGVVITGSGTTGNAVEGTYASDNGNAGVEIESGASGNVVEGTYASDNGNAGVEIESGASGNTVGGTAAGTTDFIYVNTTYGVDIDGLGTTGNVVEGDIIGTNSSQMLYGNGNSGVIIQEQATHNIVSSDVISGNAIDGVYITGSGTEDNLVAGDFIGTNSGGTAAVGNIDGVAIANGASQNTIGGTTTAARDVISGNTLDGVQLFDSGPKNVVEGDDIGTNLGATAAIPNGRAGVTLQGGATGDIVGGTAAGSGDVISGNKQYGVWLINGGTSRDVVAGDFIGTNSNGTSGGGPLANVNGVEIGAGATGNTIGGSSAAARDVISGNSTAGVVITDPGTEDNVVEGDDIGTNAGGTAPIGNGYAGVIIGNQASYNTVAGSSDIISANGTYGVLIDGTGSDFNLVAGDFIGTNYNGTSALGNTDGVDVENGAAENTIGGTTTAACNVISGNTLDGVQLSSAGPNDVVEGDYIGTNAAGTGALPNARDGVMIQGGSYGDLVGVGLGDLIAYNEGNGVQVTSGCYDNTIESDTVEYNNANGVWLDADSNDTVAGCFIGGNGDYGIYDTGSNDDLVNNTIFNNNGLGGVGY
jgi:Right handed beta helix region